jgi:asparagine synthase (glutamine-hydrolysing)
MTVLAALWRGAGARDERDCHAALCGQWPQAEHHDVRTLGEVTLGAAWRGAIAQGGADPAKLACSSEGFALLADARLDNRGDFLTPLGLTQAALLTDAQLMLRAIERWGPDVIRRFVGDFALMLWDPRNSCLHLARDVSGQRPLHWWRDGNTVAAASLAKGLLALECVPYEVDERRVLETLASIQHEGPETYFKGISRVEAGEMVTLNPAANRSRSLWQPPAQPLRFKSHADYAAALLETLDLAVACRLRDAGDNVGSHLSAGLDSSAVTSSAALRFPGMVHAYTAVPSNGLPELPAGRFGDEGPLAAETARRFANVVHHRCPAVERLPVEDLAGQLELFERTDLNLPNLAWANRINRLARDEGISVLLVGTMGNATLSYGGFELLGELLARGRVGDVAAEFPAARKAGYGIGRLWRDAAKQVLPGALVRAFQHSRQGQGETPWMINPRFAGQAAILAQHLRHADATIEPAEAVRRQMIRGVDMGTFNKGVLLQCGIELRDPTADRRLIEFCLRVPLVEFVRGGQTRALARTALLGRVPETVRLASKRGLQAPHWFAMMSAARGEIVERVLGFGKCPPAQRLLDLERMRRMLEDWPETPDEAYRYGLLRGLSAGEFLRLHDRNCRKFGDTH